MLHGCSTYAKPAKTLKTHRVRASCMLGPATLLLALSGLEAEPPAGELEGSCCASRAGLLAFAAP